MVLHWLAGWLICPWINTPPDLRWNFYCFSYDVKALEKWYFQSSHIFSDRMKSSSHFTSTVWKMPAWYIAVVAIATMVIFVIGMTSVLDSYWESYIYSMNTATPFVASMNSFIFPWRFVISMSWSSPQWYFKYARKTSVVMPKYPLITSFTSVS